MTSPTPDLRLGLGTDAAPPGHAWHWDLAARVLAGLRSARGEHGPCTAATPCAAEAVMAELAPITEFLAQVPAPLAVSSCSAPPR